MCQKLTESDIGFYHREERLFAERIRCTPNEFRLTLLKYGIIIPPHQLEQIFNLFDSDRSEFRIPSCSKVRKEVIDTDDRLRMNQFQDKAPRILT
jgi:hypothetical protein